MNREKSAQRAALIVGRIEAGANAAAVAAEFDLSPNYVYLLCRKAGVAPSARAQKPLGLVTPKRSLILRRRAIIAELHSLGMTCGAVLRLTGLNRQTLYNNCKALGLKFPYDRTGWEPTVAASKARASKMAALYRSGMTLQQIGEKYGLTRERVRQLMTKHAGMNYAGGGHHIKAVAKRQKSDASKDARFLAKYGCTFSQYVEVRDVGRAMVAAGVGIYRTPLRAFASQRNNAILRSITWELTFWQWWTIWQESGKWAERGRAKEAFVMSRFRDAGGYSAGNVYIGTLAENSSIQPNNPYRNGHPDHEKVMPAVMEKIRLAKAGRAAAGGGVRLPSKRKKDPIGVGCNRPGRYISRAWLNGKSSYFGTFDTAEEAHAAYLRAVTDDVSSAHQNSEAA